MRAPLIRAFGMVLAGLAINLSGSHASAAVENSWEPAGWKSDFSGYVEAQDRRFFSESDFGDDRPHDNYVSVALNPRWRIDSPDDDIAVTLNLFTRHDFTDDSRTHTDVREALLQKVIDNQDWRIGIGQVFWGVTESRHLVDIINQQDFLERFDGDAKLGQPLLNWNRHSDAGNLELYILPRFREREFPGPGGRLRPPLPIASARFESGAGEKHIDAAARWQWSGDGGDIALSYFHGTEREPLYRLDFTQGHAVIRPEYRQLSQWGLDAQKSIGNFMLKLEAVHRDSDTRSWASVAGFEYTIENVHNGDLGLVLEYLKDTRETSPVVSLEDDIFAGVRFSTNALSSTYFLAGIYQDRTDGGRILKLEANTRIAPNTKLTLEAWRFDQLSANELIDFFSRDDFLEIGIQYFFD